MRRLNRLVIVAWALLLAPIGVVEIEAAEIEVDPTLGGVVLADAVAAATDGDTLVLPYGTYAGDVLVDKSLVIRGTNSGDPPFISGPSFTVDGAGAQVVLQGLAFGVDLTLNAAANVQVLESHFYNGADIDGTNYKTSEGDGQLAIIGNRIHQDSTIKNIYSDDTYIAGNTLDHASIRSYVPVWIIGNEIIGPTDVHPINVNAEGHVRVIGNRVRLNANGGNTYGINIDAPAALIASNLVEVYYSGSYEAIRGINLSSRTMAKVHNNVVDGLGRNNDLRRCSYGGYEYDYAIVAYNTSSEVSGNIVVNYRYDCSFPFGGTRGAENLCWNNDNNSGCGTGTLQVDPQFIDSIDYRLADDSPAIDAGADSPFLADRDRSTNDLGIHGGPWGIEQYDAQRDPLYLGPFVFPLFDANAGFVDGALQVRALGVARLR